MGGREASPSAAANAGLASPAQPRTRQEAEGEREAHGEQPRDVARARSGPARGRAPPRSRPCVRRSTSVSKNTMRLARAEAGEVGVAVARALRAVHHEEALGAEAASLHQGLDAPAQLAFLERGEAVEERARSSAGRWRRGASVNATHATQAQTHHQAPVASMNQQTASTSGVPSATASAQALGDVAGEEWRASSG